MSFDSIVNRGDYFSAHYLAEVLPKDLKKKDGGLLPRWAEEEKNDRLTPRRGLSRLGKRYFDARASFAEFDARLRDEEAPRPTPDELSTWRKELSELHGDVLRALAFDAAPRELTVCRADNEHVVQVAYADDHLVAIECGWTPEVDAAIGAELLYPVQLDARERITSGVKLATWLFTSDAPPRYVLLLAGGVVVLADRAAWGEGRYLGVSLDTALGRNNAAEIELIAALFGADSLLPPAEGGSELLSSLLNGSRQHAVGVSTELREGLRHSVELIANEVLTRIREQDADPAQIMEPAALARQLTRESLRYLYRVLFLLYAEARPELGILPVKDDDYMQGYSMARLGDLVVRDLHGEESRHGFHLYESLDLLFRMVNKGYPAPGTESGGGEGLRFEALRSDLFEPEAITLIGEILLDEDDPDALRVDTRLRNETLYKVLRLLMLTKGRRRERGGFISYAQLGINQLGAVYEGLMSYTGFIATEELYEVAKGGDPKDGSWMIPASKVDEYPEEVFVREVAPDGHKTEKYASYPKGSFVYRLAGRDRETSASYYTPESLTKVTVELTLRHRLDQDGTTTTAREILDWKICEPALGSGAFLNEAINQVAAEYLKRRQKELGREIEPEKYEAELQKAKAYIALHNSYGVDLNETAIELAEVSLWLNVMHPGLQAPWFGLHLRRGNSLIGATRGVYEAGQLTKGTWLKETPENVPLSGDGLPSGKVFQFLLPAAGWGAVASAKEAKELAPEQAKALAAWRKKITSKVSDKKSGGRKRSQLQRLQALSENAEYLWGLVVQRLTLSEKEISREIDVWGADWLEHPEEAISKEKVYGDLVATGTPYWRLKTVMDAWSALWFWPVDSVSLLDGTDERYAQATPVIAVTEQPSLPAPSPAEESIGFGQVYITESLIPGVSEQGDLAEWATEAKTQVPKPRNQAPSKPKNQEPSRSMTPVASLDDWLDFAEALLGKLPVQGDTLVKQFDTLAELETHEDVLPEFMGMVPDHRLPGLFPWLNHAEEVTKQHGFFHWELQFAQIFTQAGFDLQVGNPPWVRPDFDEPSVLAEIDPWFKLTEKPAAEDIAKRKNQALSKSIDNERFYLQQLIAANATAELLGSITTFPLLSGTRPDLYRAFMCRSWLNLHQRGVAGLIHPDTHFSGVKEGKLRSSTYKHLRLHAHFSNRYQLFEIEGTRQFGVNIYGTPNGIEFTHLSWLFLPSTLMDSLNHDGSGELPGIKHKGRWEVRPHKERLINVDVQLLAEWQGLTNSSDLPVEETPLLYPITNNEAGAIAALARYKQPISDLLPKISIGYDEGLAKKKGLIRWGTKEVSDFRDVVLQGPHLGVGTPLSKQPRIPCKTNRDWDSWDTSAIPVDTVPRTNYVRNSPLDEYIGEQDTWGSRKYTEYYRLAWRDMIPFDTERSLFAALIPPGPAHVNAVRSMALSDNRTTVLQAGFWASLPLDYLLRVTGRGHLSIAEANWMPAAHPDHPLTSPLILRAMRLNCLTKDYSDIWSELYEGSWNSEDWAVKSPHSAHLGQVANEWNHNTPLRTEQDRRAALVELDALVALWLGMTADQLIAIYRSRYPVLSDYEAQIRFDRNGRKIAGNHNTYGHGQTKKHFERLMAHLDPEVNGPVPEGYAAPFYKTDRENEYRQAYATFAERMRAAGWPVPGDES
ncbi:class I SAM-dependent DNA methyltransferase [Actinocorallia libanotica]|uniref:site-specific DNA-methyltransferase (adenine-specific) n=1 Tax=Actinocorallia libanotica TaxID=46162 RepID=A0ABN1RT11_9ACTN